MIRAVIFDLDGVLVSTDELHYQAWKKLADEEGIPFDHEVNHRLRGVSRMESLEILLEASARLYTDDEKKALAKRKNDAYRALLQSLTDADVLPGATEMLNALRQRGVHTAIASASKNTPLILSRTGLAGKVDVVVDGNDTTRSKPDPEGFLLAAQRLEIPPAECMVVEDAAAGIEAGRRAGMAVFGIGSPESLPGMTRLASGLHTVSPEELLRS